MQPRAIVLEDQQDLQRLLTIFLEQRGYEVISASDPLVCPVYADLEARCPHEFGCGDFLLTDNQMPHLSGLEFIERQHLRGCKGVVRNKAVFSADWNDIDLEKAADLGCRTFAKPYDFARLSVWLDDREGHILPDRKLDELPPPSLDPDRTRSDVRLCHPEKPPPTTA